MVPWIFCSNCSKIFLSFWTAPSNSSGESMYLHRMWLIANAHTPTHIDIDLLMMTWKWSNWIWENKSIHICNKWDTFGGYWWMLGLRHSPGHNHPVYVWYLGIGAGFVQAQTSMTDTDNVCPYDSMYREVSNIWRTLVGNTIVDHSDVGAAPTTSSLST